MQPSGDTKSLKHSYYKYLFFLTTFTTIILFNYFSVNYYNNCKLVKEDKLAILCNNCRLYPCAWFYYSCSNTIWLHHHLGVHYDNRLTWDIHVDAAIMKSRKSLHALKALRCYFTEIEMIKLITANAFSKLYYASMVWLLPNLKENLVKKLFSHSGQVLKIVDKNLSHIALHKKFCRSTPKIFSIYQTSMNLFHQSKLPSKKFNLWP